MNEDFTIIHIDETDSTNHWLMQQRDPCVVVADYQTAGKGCGSNTWESERGKNLTFSMLIHPESLLASRQFRITEVTSVALCETLEDNLLQQVTIKWPNDIYVGDRKLCGMLIENSLGENGVAASVIGVGLNVNQTVFPQVTNATSLALSVGKEVSLEEALERLSALFESAWPLLGTAELFASYSAFLFQKGVPARYHDLLSDREYTGVIEGVAPDGRLCIREGAACHYYQFKEVSYIL